MNFATFFSRWASDDELHAVGAVVSVGGQFGYLRVVK